MQSGELEADETAMAVNTESIWTFWSDGRPGKVMKALQSKTWTFAEFEIAVKLLTWREKVIAWLTAAEPLNWPLEVSKVTELVEPEFTENKPDGQA